LLQFTSGRAQAGPTYTPKPGSAERKAIVDALRKPVSKKVKTRVIFELGYFQVRDGWAMVSGSALKSERHALWRRVFVGRSDGSAAQREELVARAGMGLRFRH
jgi:hypothetical protein